MDKINIMTTVTRETKPTSQKEDILFHLTFIGPINSIKAIKEYGITRLASVIHLLRNEGHSIKSEEIKFKNRHGRKAFFVKYSLEQ